MSRIVQEKFEVHAPNPSDGSNAWVSDASARTRKGLQTRHDGSGQYESYGASLNCLPPGMNIEAQDVREINPQRTVIGGTDDVTDNPKGHDFVKGYVGLEMSPTEDMYTREHNDAFYDEIKVDGVTGYLERNNYLDRE